MIYFENLSIRFDRNFLLRQQTKAIVKGQMVAVLGDNGSGKSTFLKVIAGIIPPEQGKIFINKKLLETYTCAQLAHIRGFLGAELTCYWALKVKDILGDNLPIHLQEILNLIPLQDNTFQILSSGEKARVMLALQLSKNPQILLLDEITSHLDTYYQVRSLELLQDFTKNGSIVILALHQEDLAYTYCHQVWKITDQALLTYKKKPAILKQIS